jgi:hypothetical protein
MTMPPSATPAAPWSSPPSSGSAGSADPPADPPAEPVAPAAALLDDELLDGEPVAGELVAGGGVVVVFFFFFGVGARVERVGSGGGRVVARVLGFGCADFVSVGVGDDDAAANCGQITSARMLGGGCLPPSCHTHASVEPGFGLWLLAPSLA